MCREKHLRGKWMKRCNDPGRRAGVKAVGQIDRNCARNRYCVGRLVGMLVGISSGATLAAIAQKLKELPAGSRVLGFNYDTGERYLSVPDFLPE